MRRRDVERRSESGVTLIEGVIVVMMVAILSIMIFQSVRSLAGTQTYSRDQGTVVDLSERVLEHVVRDARYAVRVLCASSEDDDYRAAIDLPTGMIFPSSAYPSFSDDGIFKQDASGAPRTGNLFVAFCAQPTMTLDLSFARDGSDLFRVDMYRVVAYFITEREDDGLDLARWCSQPLARWADLASISDVGRRSLVGQRLLEQGVMMTWDCRSDASEAFQLIDPVTGVLIPVVTPLAVVVEDPAQSIPRMFEAKRAEIAPNGSGSSRVRVPLYAIPSGDFPAGFEIKIDGSGMGRLMCVRIVSAMRRGDDLVNFAQVSRLVGLRDV